MIWFVVRTCSGELDIWYSRIIPIRVNTNKQFIYTKHSKKIVPTSQIVNIVYVYVQSSFTYSLLIFYKKQKICDCSYFTCNFFVRGTPSQFLQVMSYILESFLTKYDGCFFLTIRIIADPLQGKGLLLILLLSGLWLLLSVYCDMHPVLLVISFGVVLVAVLHWMEPYLYLIILWPRRNRENDKRVTYVDDIWTPSSIHFILKFSLK